MVKAHVKSMLKHYSLIFILNIASLFLIVLRCLIKYTTRHVETCCLFVVVVVVFFVFFLFYMTCQFKIFIKTASVLYELLISRTNQE